MVNTNPLYTPAEMAHQFADSGAVGLIAIDRLRRQGRRGPAENVDPARSSWSTLPTVLPPLKRVDRADGAEVRQEDDPAGALPACDVPARARARPRAPRGGRRSARVSRGADARQSIAALQYTGGTTGVAKGAMLTHGNLLANVFRASRRGSRGSELGTEVMLTALPLYHIFAFTANLMIFFAVGGRNILIPSPRPFTNMKLVMEREPVTWFTGLNTLFIALMNEPWFQAKKDWKLKGTVAGGMALAPAVGALGADDRTPIFQGYGLTETSPVVTLNPFHRAKMASIGVPLPGTDVRLVDDQGNDVADRTAGRAARARTTGDGGLLAAAGRNRQGLQGRLAPDRRHRDHG